jgi:uroporphyrinogen-III decarboxylase
MNMRLTSTATDSSPRSARTGGFILSSGCSIPIDAKPENVKAMLAAVKKYRP